MSLLEGINPAPKRILKVFFIVDASEKIGSPLMGLNAYPCYGYLV